METVIGSNLQAANAFVVALERVGLCAQARMIVTFRRVAEVMDVDAPNDLLGAGVPDWRREFALVLH
jgi:hypothetical protein